jgi:hypothetical protein
LMTMVLMCWCIDDCVDVVTCWCWWLCWSVDVLMRVDKLMWLMCVNGDDCVDVLMTLSMCWWHWQCVDVCWWVMLMTVIVLTNTCWSADVLWWLCKSVDVKIGEWGFGVQKGHKLNNDVLINIVLMCVDELMIVLMCWCVGVCRWLWWRVDALMCRCVNSVDVLMSWWLCVLMTLRRCVDELVTVLMMWWCVDDCVDVCWCVDVSMTVLMCRWLCW